MSHLAIVALETLSLPPVSHSIGSASSAVLACHQVSATTATAVSSTCTTFLTPGMPVDLGGVEALHLAAEHRAILDRGVEHARQLEVDAVDLSCRSTLSAVSSRFSGLPAIFQSFGSLSFGLLRHRQLGGGFRHLAVGGRLRPDGVCVIDAVRRACTRPPAPSTRWPRPGSASCAPRRRPCAHTRATRGCRGCRRSRIAPGALARTFSPGVGYSVVTFDQSHSSSSATSWARPVSVPWPISERAMRMTTVSSGWITTQTPISGEPSAARTTFGAERQIEAERQAAADGGGADDEGAAIDFRNVIHVCPPLRVRRGVDRRADLLEGAAPADVGDLASMSASVGFGLFLSSSADRHDHAGLAVAALRHVVIDPGLLHLVQHAVLRRGLRWW